MMVSKIAVVALVLIVSCPILIGYGMNLNETTYTEYKQSDDVVDVTGLLTNSTAYNYAHADINQINSKFLYGAFPYYNSITSKITSLPLVTETYYGLSWVEETQNMNYPYFYESFDYDRSQNQHNMDIYGMVEGVETLLEHVDYIRSFYYDNVTDSYTYTFYSPNGFLVRQGTGDITKIVLKTVSGSTDVTISRYHVSTFADLSAGYYFAANYHAYVSSTVLPTGTKSALVTINLDSITAANYKTVLLLPGTYNYYLEKTTTDGVVSWKAINALDASEVIDLYYDPTKQNNSYQVFVDIEKTGSHEVTFNSEIILFNDYKRHIEFRYVGNWPTLIGSAKSYFTYSKDVNYEVAASRGESYVNVIGFSKASSQSDRSPTYRVDDAIYKGFEYTVMENQMYNPALFKTIPSTTISNISVYGTSLTFGDNTYPVTDGKITINGRNIPVEGLVLSSTPIYGGYENWIGNTYVSSSDGQARIIFNGVWKADVKTVSMEQTTKTKTTWEPGHFAWDGIDQNFLMIGLLTALGAFIALGIAYRKTKAALGALLVVCGGAVILFFTMM